MSKLNWSLPIFWINFNSNRLPSTIIGSCLTIILPSVKVIMVTLNLSLYTLQLVKRDFNFDDAILKGNEQLAKIPSVLIDCVCSSVPYIALKPQPHPRVGWVYVNEVRMRMRLRVSENLKKKKSDVNGSGSHKLQKVFENYFRAMWGLLFSECKNSIPLSFRPSILAIDSCWKQPYSS